MEARPPLDEGRMDRDLRCRPGYTIQFCKHGANSYKQHNLCAKQSPERHCSMKDFSERIFQYRHFLSQRRNETSRGEEDGGGGNFITHDLYSAARSPAGLSIAWQTWNPDQDLDLCFGTLHQHFSAGLDESLICSSTIISMHVHNLGRIYTKCEHAFS